MPHIFISYAKKDTRALAEALAAALNGLPGVSAWMDVSLEADSSWAAQIQHEIDRSDYVIVLLSPDVNRPVTATQARSFVLNEIDYAQQERKPILPVMVQRTKQPVQIAGIQYIDLTRTPDDPAPVVERVRQKFNLPVPATAPAPVAAPLSPRESRRPSRRMLALGAVALVVIAALALAALNRGNPGGSATPTAIVQASAQPSGDATSPPSDTATTPTLSSFQQLQTAQMQLTHSAGTQAAADLTVTQDTALSANATAQQIMATEAAAQETLIALSWTPYPTNTPDPPVPPTPTFTPTLSATPSPTIAPDPLQAALDAAHAISGSNADWQALHPEGFQHTFEDGVTMVLVPAGCFMMGSNDYEDAQPVHEQCFDAPFWIDQTEVTQADFERLGGVKASANAFAGDQRPVEGITWFEARDFCALRGARLPTEAEWEYAARGPDAWEYAWEGAFVPDNVVYRENANGQTAAVGSRPMGRSWVGAMDMSGNVWEWTSSLYLPYDSREDREADTGSSTDVLRVLRGGSWFNVTDDLRAAKRIRNGPVSRYVDDGFRCARSA